MPGSPDGPTGATARRFGKRDAPSGGRSGSVVRAPTGYLLAALAAACWAAGGLTAKWLFTPLGAGSVDWPLPPPGVTTDPRSLAAARALAAFPLLLVYLFATRRQTLAVRWRDLPFLALFGVVGLAAMHYAYYEAISLTSVATAILLEYLAPVIVLMLSVAFLGERPTWTLPVGVTLSITGCALVVGAIGGNGLLVRTDGIVWGLASAVFFALYSVLGRVAVRRFGPWTLLVYGLGAASLFWVAAIGGPGPMVALAAEPAVRGAVVFLAVVGTIVPFAAFLKALQLIDATRATVTATLEPVIAAAAARVLLGEGLLPSQILGGVLVIAAVAVVGLQSRKKIAAESRLP